MSLFGPSESEKKQGSHDKGQKDFAKSGGLPNSNPLAEMVTPTYSPPSGYEKDYKAGWDNAKKQKK